ncbi:MAG: SMC-Scp complex subunit ScpB [Candidatus Woesearchaeota archaeon]
MTDMKKEVEAILFAAGRAVSMDEFQVLLELKTPGLVKEAIRELILDYRQAERPLLIVEEDSGWKLTVKEGFLSLVQKVNPHTELSKTILETLAVIAWKQPALQSDVIKVRTNKAYDHISELERLGFVAKERHGRSFIIKVTQKFLDYFDLPDNKAIKDVFKDFKEVEAAVQKKVDEFEKEEERLGPDGEDAQEAVDVNAKDIPDDNADYGSDADTEADSGDVGESSDDNAEDQSGDLKEERTLTTGEDGAIELEPYIDVPPERHKVHTGAEVEIYDDVSPGQEKAAEEGEKAHDDKAREGKDIFSDDDEDAEAAEDGSDTEDSDAGASGEHKETPAEKARRLARELIEEDEIKEEEKDENLPVRNLHPKLEEFVAGSMKHIAPRGQEDHSDEIVEKRDIDEHRKAAAGSADKGVPVEESSADGRNKDMPVEEYPGQFDKEAREEEAKKHSAGSDDDSDDDSGEGSEDKD